MNAVAPSDDVNSMNVVAPSDDASYEDTITSDGTDNSAEPNAPDFGDFLIVPRLGHFMELYNHRKSMDVILRSEGNPKKDIYAHKCVLASQSDYFDVIFLTIIHFR
jgi:hypothetical protein